MFTNISWTNYILVVILFLAIYYVFIAIRFYFPELKNLAGKRKSPQHPVHSEFSTAVDNDSEYKQVQPELFPTQNCFVETSDDTFQEVELLIGTLKEAIEEASRKKHIKQEFFLYLQLILKRYPALKNSTFQSAINELIISECAKYGSIVLREEEVVMLWNDV